MQLLTPQVLTHFPSVDYAFAYGSGAIRQRGYDAAKASSKSPMIDLIFVVKDTRQWHTDNLSRNRHHYSALKHLGPSAVQKIQEGYGAHIYFNPNVEINGQVFKYGVIHRMDLNRDLLTWDTFYVSGRLQKPVVMLQSDEELSESNRVNLQNALRTALLLLPSAFSETDLYTTVTGLSYHGDIRMKFAENPKKISNIVLPNLPLFQELYHPIINRQFPSIQLGQPALSQDLGEAATKSLLDRLPNALLNEIARLATADNVRMSQLPAHRTRTATYIRKAIAETVKRTSTSQTMKGVLTAGAIKSARYVFSKIKKRFDDAS